MKLLHYPDWKRRLPFDNIVYKDVIDGSKRKISNSERKTKNLFIQGGVWGSEDGKRYSMQSVEAHLRIARFGSLIKHISPVNIRSDGAIMRLIDRHFSLVDGSEHYVCSGEALKSGIPLAMQYSGTGYNQSIRVLGDFGSTMYTIVEQNSTKGADENG